MKKNLFLMVMISIILSGCQKGNLSTDYDEATQKIISEGIYGINLKASSNDGSVEANLNVNLEDYDSKSKITFKDKTYEISSVCTKAGEKCKNSILGVIDMESKYMNIDEQVNIVLDAFNELFTEITTGDYAVKHKKGEYNVKAEDGNVTVSIQDDIISANINITDQLEILFELTK